MSTRKLAIFVLRSSALALAVLLPLVSAVFSVFILLKTYKISQIIAKNSFLVSKQGAEEEDYDFSAKAKELISQTGQLIGVTETKLKWGREDRVNILLLGKASSDYPGSGLTDTIILASFNPKTHQAALLSIPRDLYVNIPDTKQYTKLNAIYHYGELSGEPGGGIRYMSKSIEEITGQSVDYYIILDFHGFEKLVNEIGGVRVNVSKELDDKTYPGPNYSYQPFHIDAGWHDLDGETALKYVRTRHNPGGDFGRAFRQQQVLAAIKNKFFSLEGVSLLGKANSILDIISQNVETDIDFSEYGSFLALVRNINEHNVINKVLDNRGNDPILTNYAPFIGGRRAYFLRTARGDWGEVQEIATNIFDLEKLRKTYEQRSLENPSLVVINCSGDASLSKAVVERLQAADFKKISQLACKEEENQGQTLILDYTEGVKPYSLDTLSKLLGGEVEIKEGEEKNYDIEVVLGQESEQFFKKDDIVLPEEAFTQFEY